MRVHGDNTRALLGGGGHASDVLCVVEALGSQYINHVYVADDVWQNRGRFDGRDVQLLDSIDNAITIAPFVISVGYPTSRRNIHDRAAELGGRASAALVHPGSSIGVTTRLGSGVVVMGQTWISAGVEIGDHVHVGYGSTIGHDTRIGAFGAVMPSASISGDVTIGEGVLVGTNATILQGLSIGDNAVVGAGAVVTRDVEPGVTVVGSPARPLTAAGPQPNSQG